MDWIQAPDGNEWMKVSAFDNDAARNPVTIVLSRESVAGMVLRRV